MLIQAHTPDLVTQLEERSRKSREQRIQDGKPALGHMGNIDADTYVTTESFNVCLRATAAWIRAVDVAETNESGTAMALTRPPGHHAEKGSVERLLLTILQQQLRCMHYKIPTNE
jgi:acetoin utilization deacetylase AcuC-like enzyme